MPLGAEPEVHAVKLTRRSFLRTTVAVGAVGVAGACGRESAPAPGATVEGSRAEALRWFSAKGYAPIAASPLITEIPFNDGLAFDEHFDSSRDALYVVQPCSRVEDVHKKDSPGTLPRFTIFGVVPAPNTPVADPVADIVGFLTGPAGIDPARLRVTTTDLSRAVFPLLAELGIASDRIRLQPVEKAMREGAGSGFFAPAGHPHHPAIPTFSVEFVMADGSEIEIAEIATEPGDDSGGAIGLERVTMARNDRLITWSEQLPVFKQSVEEDAESRGVALPVGYYEILGLPRPNAAMTN